MLREKMDKSIYQAFVNFNGRKPSPSPLLFNHLIIQFWRENKARLNLYILRAYLCLFPIKLLASRKLFIAGGTGGRGGFWLCHNKIFLILSPLPIGSVGF